MKAIILAAGKGTRISRMIEAIPKCVLPVDGTPLIRRNIMMLIERNIKPVVCVGYYKSEIYKALEGMDVTYYYNPFYDVTNSIASIWFARAELTEDTIIMNGDVYFNESILDLIISTEKECALLVDTERITVGDYFLKLENGLITKYGKELPIQERSCEYVGIGKIKSKFLEYFSERLNMLIGDQHHQLWWENILYSLIKEKRIDTIDISGHFWAEIDYFDDYERILAHIDLKNGSVEGSRGL
ncbi:phosphocholine cytidylyltransferase family protein [Paenibacillus marchantiae]|uniref:phosphocholine cytidylyltransferase family protein n=1 Tax=Paenibacillus TaxID=44249 RepID=UPI0022A94555|nr:MULTISPECIES: phosphocholine cytidylyltransferase family protein [Paenibacillus]MCZ1264086.1 phosphocholine cytidylyltransferase family protein [Paenibacillus tundrae]WDQ33163.1 phosphocholine cytidylyltransferase family protein [Paenibacillus marchantiae]